MVYHYVRCYAQIQVLKTSLQFSLTSAVTEENKAQAAFLGVMHMLQKPVEISRLATVIQQEDALHQIKATWTNTDTVLSELLQRYPNATDEDAEICT